MQYMMLLNYEAINVQKGIKTTTHLFINSEYDWDIHWALCQSLDAEGFQTNMLTETQRLNHFAGHLELTGKDKLVQNIKRKVHSLIQNHQIEEAEKYKICLPSFVLPEEYNSFKNEFEKNPCVYIAKPV